MSGGGGGVNKEVVDPPSLERVTRLGGGAVELGAAEPSFGWCGVCCGRTDVGGMFGCWCGVDRWCGVCLDAAPGFSAGAIADF